MLVKRPPPQIANVTVTSKWLALVNNTFNLIVELLHIYKTFIDENHTSQQLLINNNGKLCNNEIKTQFLTAGIKINRDVPQKI